MEAEAAQTELLNTMVASGMAPEAALEQLAAHPLYTDSLFAVATQRARENRGYEAALDQVGRAQAAGVDEEYAAQVRARNEGWQ